LFCFLSNRSKLKTSVFQWLDSVVVILLSLALN
jgi:hypothetical protein